MKRFLAIAATAVALVALVIGGFHWQVSGLESADVRWSTDVGPSAGAEVVGSPTAGAGGAGGAGT